MKKFFLLFASAFLVISCSSDDDSPSNDDGQTESNVYIKKITNTVLMDSDGTTETYIVEFEHDENKRLNKIITNNGSYTDLIYENNLLVKYVSYEGDILLSDGNIYYENNKINYTISTDGGYIFRTDYSYSTDGKLKKTMTCGGTEPCINSDNYIEYTFHNNNIIQEIESMAIFENPIIFTYNYSYDDKKNPFTNYDSAIKILLKDLTKSSLNANNYVQQTDYAGANVIYTNTYTSDEYLKSQEGRYESNGNFYVSFEYEYVEL